MAKENVNERVEPIEPELEVDFDNEEDPIILNQLMGAAEEVRNAPKVKIIMHNQEGQSGDQPVFVAVNGMGYSIPRDVPVILPLPIVKALEDAVEVKYYREEQDGQHFGPIKERPVRRFPFSIMS